MKKCLWLSLLLLPFILSAQEYNALLVPDSLKKNADVVTRIEEKIFEIKSPGKAIEHERHVYTIFNQSADYLGEYKTDYGSFNSIKYVSGSLYDSSGKRLKHFKLNDMSDFSVEEDNTLANSERFKKYDFYNRVYPYTVEFEEEDEINGVRYIDDWIPQGINDASVQHSKFVVITPKNYKLRYKPVNCTIQPVITDDGDKRIYSWELNNLAAKKKEELAPYWLQLVPYVMIAPSDFEVQGYSGNMSTWENYGKFIYGLIKGRDALPDAIKRKVHELTDSIKESKQKINVLYDYLQKNSRYISIQFGIGGWQPFDATYVATKRYGDCKALSNYMVALLKEAGISAKYVEIEAGENASRLIEDFPCSQFNHVTCCVPIGKDTIWLECTSQSKPPGYAGSFTGNRKALLIDENGGHVVQTPIYSVSDNLKFRKIDAEIDVEGNLNSTVYTQYKAERQDYLDLFINEVSKERMMDYIKSEINLPTYDLVKFNYKEDKNKIPSIFTTMVISAPNYAQVSGRRLFLIPDIMNRSNNKIKPLEERKYDLELNEEKKDIDSVVIKIPPGFQPEAVPQDLKIESKFGRYVSSTKVTANTISYYRSQEQYAGRFPPSDYNELAKFFEQIYKADRSKIVLVKKE